MKYIKGEILTIDGFIKNNVIIKDDNSIEISKDSFINKSLTKGLIIPSIVNAHTHIGDSFIKGKKVDLTKDVEKLVAPPNGLKHRLLRNASKSEIIQGMKNSINEMEKIGTSHFCDFRENGVEGILNLNKALENKNIKSITLSRPSELKYDKNEMKELLKISDGVGLSSITDWDYQEIKKIIDYAKDKGKIVSLHASEVIREDIDVILDLKPDFLIHMIKATESDLIKVKEEDIPIVICPRSNAFFNLKVDLKLMKRIGITLMLGTDNAMLNSPNVLVEVKFLKNCSNVFSLEELIKMVTYTPRKVLNLDDCINGSNLSGNFVILNKDSLNPIYVSKQNQR
jgi:cytosine/adenosine deaminase-related metal-dependent hydrolase